MSNPSHILWSAALVAGALLLAGCGDVAGGAANGTGTGTETGAAPGQQGWSKHVVVDEHGFGQPINAITLDVPPGWLVSSQIRWDGVNGQCSMGAASTNVRMTSPDGRQQIDFIPGFLIVNYPDAIVAKGARPGDFCVIGTVTSGEQLIREIAVPRLRPGWRIESITQAPPPPELDRMVQAAAGSGANAQGYALNALLLSPDGAQVEQFYVAGVVMRMPQLVQGMAPPVQNQNMRTWSVRGPREAIPQLVQTAEQIRANLQVNPEWSERMNRHNGEMQRGSTPAPPSPSSGRSGGSPDLTDTDGWLRRQDEESGRQRRRVDRIYERQVCVDPDTGERYYAPETATCP